MSMSVRENLLPMPNVDHSAKNLNIKRHSSGFYWQFISLLTLSDRTNGLLVNATLKVSSKKAKPHLKRSVNLRNAAASTAKYQVPWYAASIALHAWYAYWVAYEIFVWHKPIDQINILNYVGAAISISCVWAGTRIWKNKTKTAGKTKQQKMQPDTPEPLREQIQVPQASSNGSACTHHLGYLHERHKSKDIPSECLMCEKVIECFSPKK
jgi:hypothetical protein